MAITKETVEDKIEIVGEHKNIQIRTATIIKEDGVEISRSYHRHVVESVISVKNDDDTWTHTDTDMSGQDATVRAIAAAAWTDTVKSNYNAWVEANKVTGN